MEKYLPKLNRSHILITFIVLILASITLGSLLYTKINRTSYAIVLDRFGQHQLTLVKAGSRSIQEYFERKKLELTELTKEPNIEQAFENYVKNYQDSDFVDLGYIDNEDKIALIKNKDNTQYGLGLSVSDRDYIIFAKNPHNKDRIFITHLIARAGNHVNKPLLLISKGIYDGNSQYQGTMLMTIAPEYLRDKFIEPLKTNPASRVTILYSSGKVIFSRYENLNNQNLFEYAQNVKWNNYESFTKGLTQALTQEEGYTTWSWLEPNELFPEKKVVAYTKIPLNYTSSNWILLVDSPHTDIDSPLNTLTFDHTATLVLSFTVTFLTCIIFTLGLNIAYKEGYLKASKK